VVLLKEMVEDAAVARPYPTSHQAQARPHAAGLNYDPDKLARVLADRWPQVYGRALTITTKLGGWIASVAQVRGPDIVYQAQNRGSRGSEFAGPLPYTRPCGASAIR
jgi:hypothetical protein